MAERGEIESSKKKEGGEVEEIARYWQRGGGEKVH